MPAFTGLDISLIVDITCQQRTLATSPLSSLPPCCPSPSSPWQQSCKAGSQHTKHKQQAPRSTAHSSEILCVQQQPLDSDVFWQLIFSLGTPLSLQVYFLLIPPYSYTCAFFTGYSFPATISRLLGFLFVCLYLKYVPFSFIYVFIYLFIYFTKQWSQRPLDHMSSAHFLFLSTEQCRCGSHKAVTTDGFRDLEAFRGSTAWWDRDKNICICCLVCSERLSFYKYVYLSKSAS